MYDEYWGSMKITTHLDHATYCKTAPNTDWSNRWTLRVFIINIRRDYPEQQHDVRMSVVTARPLAYALLSEEGTTWFFWNDFYLKVKAKIWS